MSSKHEKNECIDKVRGWLDSLREKRTAVEADIIRESKERDRLKEEIRVLTERFSQMSDSVAKKNANKEEYDTTIEEAETAYNKIMESSQTLLHVLKKEVKSLEKKHNHNI